MEAQTNHALQCQCGTIKGDLVVSPGALRAVCYCLDCQAYAHFFGQPVLDARGGTEVVATLPQYIHFTQGIEALVCMSLSERGLLRWYAACCQTPIANTPRDFKVAYVGLLHNALTQHGASLHDSFGVLRMVVNTRSAKGPVRSSPLRNFVALLGIGRSLICARLGGGYKQSPFFSASGVPIKPPRVITRAEREALKRAALGAPPRAVGDSS